MLNLSLAAIHRGEARGEWEVAPDDAVWGGLEASLVEPVRVSVEARPIGEGGVLVRGRLKTAVDLACRRCLSPVIHAVDEGVELLFEPLEAEEAAELDGEVHALPSRGDELALDGPLREQLLLAIPAFVLCREDCRGLCAHCGADLNEGTCSCAPTRESGPWEALKKLEFD